MGSQTPAQARAAGGAAPQAGAPSSVLADLGSLSYEQLSARLRELRQQRQEIAGRRDNLARDFEKATGANQEGIGERLRVLDGNIAQYELSIYAVGQELAVKAGTKAPPPPRPQIIQQGASDDEVAAAMFGTFLGTALLTAFIVRRFARRRWGAPRQNSTEVPAGTTERLDRIEQAVDTVAVEIERISENQRFMTRLMTETQLGASIAAVRDSTDLAKAAVGGRDDV